MQINNTMNPCVYVLQKGTVVMTDGHGVKRAFTLTQDGAIASAHDGYIEIVAGEGTLVAVD